MRSLKFTAATGLESGLDFLVAGDLVSLVEDAGLDSLGFLVAVVFESDAALVGKVLDLLDDLVDDELLDWGVDGGGSALLGL